MKILYLCFDSGIPFWGSKGASIHIREFTKALKASGHDVDISVARLGAHTSNGAEVHELAPAQADLFRWAHGQGEGKLSREASSFAGNFTSWAPPSEDFDLVYERYSLFGVSGLTLARKHGVPFVLEVNSPLLEEEKTHRTLVMEPLAKAIEGHLFSQADWIIAVSEGVKQYIRSVSPEARVVVLPNGVDAEPFIKADDDSRLKEQLGEDKFSVGFVGSMKPWHGVECLVQAFRRLAQDDRYRLVLVGDGPLRTSLQTESETLDLEGKVILTGAIDYDLIPGTLKALDVLVAPYPPTTDFYFSPIKIFEYMASARPIVASSIGQIPEILEHERNALLVPPGDEEALAHALRRLEGDRQLGGRLGRQAQQDVQGSHTWISRVKTIEPTLIDMAERSSLGYLNKPLAQTAS